MVFNSWLFALFFLLFYVLYENLKGKSRKVLLLVASYLFYGAWDARFLLLIAFSTVVDFYIGKQVALSSEKKAKGLISLSLLVNLGILGYFKYAGFFIDSAKSLLASVGLQNNWGTLEIVLPVGISFYTFQTISYSIDVYRKDLKPTNSLLDFACFVAFFPQLVAGPIERAKDLLPQIENLPESRKSRIDLGVFLVILGLFKKLVIADSCANIVDYYFNNPDQTQLNVILITCFFAFQIYADFSGYTDIARGIARMMGIELSINFLQPYLVTNPSAFWRNWHISLSSWLRDYLYIPLGGNRQGAFRTNLNLFITMVLGGLWHGAGWAFVLWGAFHGLWLMLHRVLHVPLGSLKKGIGLLFYPLALLTTFFLTLVGWFLFRLGSLAPEKQLSVAGELWPKVFTWSQINNTLLPALVFYLTLVIILQWSAKYYDRFEHLNYLMKTIILAALIIGCFFFSKVGGAQFIYFQF